MRYIPTHHIMMKPLMSNTPRHGLLHPKDSPKCSDIVVIIVVIIVIDGFHCRPLGGRITRM